MHLKIPGRVGSVSGPSIPLLDLVHFADVPRNASRRTSASVTLASGAAFQGPVRFHPSTRQDFFLIFPLVAAKRVSLFQRPDGKEHASVTAVCPLLIICDLPPHVDETLLAAGVSKLLREPSTNVADTKGPTKLKSTATIGARGAKEGSLHRVLLVSDRETEESWRYGFAEFFTKEVRIAL